MKQTRIISTVVFLLSAGNFISSNEALSQVSSVQIRVSAGPVGFFYESLRPYGEWIELEPGFFAWRPVRVLHGWQPYRHGHWAWTHHGWYWVSSEPFGWAVYHYGRWYFDEYLGWIWIPDDVWGPAWVEWRYNGDYIGWAPLPPYATFSITVGIRFTKAWYAPHHYWCFVRHRHFGFRNYADYVAAPDHARRLIRTTRYTGRYEVDRDRVVNRGIDRKYIEKRGRITLREFDVKPTRERNERTMYEGTRPHVERYNPSRGEMDRSGSARIEARKIERPLSLDLQRVEQSRSQRSTRTEQQRNRPTDLRKSDTDNGRDRSPTPGAFTPRSNQRWSVRPESGAENRTPSPRGSSSVRARPAPSDPGSRANQPAVKEQRPPQRSEPRPPVKPKTTPRKRGRDG